MAEHKVSGGTMLLFIDPNGGTTYDTVVCLKSVGVSDSINPIDTSSWCGPGKLPGLLNISYSFDGYHIQDVDTGRISGTDLRILLRNKTRIGWKLSPESPQLGDEVQTGTGFISDLSSTYSFDSVGSFNFTLQVFGIPSTQVSSLYVGMYYQGGMIAYLDETNLHGLIIPVYDVGGGLYQLYIMGGIWGNESIYLGGTSPDYGQGLNNTNYIIENDAMAEAANLCQSLTYNGYNDWFLPSQGEWNYIITNMPILAEFLTGFAATGYWTSTESQTDTSGLFAMEANTIFPIIWENYKFIANGVVACRYF